MSILYLYDSHNFTFKKLFFTKMAPHIHSDLPLFLCPIQSIHMEARAIFSKGKSDHASPQLGQKLTCCIDY